MLKLNIEAQHSFKSLVSKMGSEYFLSLSNEDKLRYNDKLTLSNGVKLEDPYLLTTGWLDDLRKLPKISWKNVISYLVDTPSQYTKESLKAFKSLDGIEYFREGHVQECFYHETCSKSFCFLKSKVLPSQRQSKSAVMYNVWVAINVQHGWILTGNCTCIAGLGSVCSHVGALLFKLEAVVHYKLNEAVACTGQICSWKATKKYVEPAPIILPFVIQCDKEISTQRKVHEYIRYKLAVNCIANMDLSANAEIENVAQAPVQKRRRGSSLLREKPDWMRHLEKQPKDAQNSNGTSLGAELLLDQKESGLIDLEEKNATSVMTNYQTSWKSGNLFGNNFKAHSKILQDFHQ